MKASRLSALITAAALSTAALGTPAAGAQEAAAPVEKAVDTSHSSTNTTASGTDKQDPSNAEQPTTPWLRIVEGSSQGPAGVIIAILFGIISVGMAIYQQFGEYLPKLG
ncbi:hypothetical protein [Corynebacterium minutissimum]|uniref:hypothetical protein n=1 Tax=Corynebacterium minutissimum TaxID=38301 RepID=UPI001EF18DFE|nr:hypothetical protein [Corynebacterium minutissimum]MCG7229974.1 hypothetical protein [Corynebacterium minutissimum]MCG7239423.1 hypothetical protein [Corynebacterium minutissimum]